LIYFFFPRLCACPGTAQSPSVGMGFRSRGPLPFKGPPTLFPSNTHWFSFFEASFGIVFCVSARISSPSYARSRRCAIMAPFDRSSRFEAVFSVSFLYFADRAFSTWCHTGASFFASAISEFKTRVLNAIFFRPSFPKKFFSLACEYWRCLSESSPFLSSGAAGTILRRPRLQFLSSQDFFLPFALSFLENTTVFFPFRPMLSR